MSQFSVIIPVYNRPDEIDELLTSLAEQQNKDFEVIIVEDGSTIDCESVVESYRSELKIKYFYKKNTGPGDSRNFGMKKATGSYLIFFDSDCIIPANYFESLTIELSNRNLDAFGGRDDSHDSFSNTQKAINYTMTSFLTTGGVRGNKRQLNKFQPRSFNMGISREVYEEVGGFSDIHPGEDPDLSFRIMDAGFKTGLVNEAFVYHKRRIDFSKFAKQVFKFGLVRVILNRWYPNSKSPLFILPSMFLVFSIMSVILGAFVSPWIILPILTYILLAVLHALLVTKSVTVAILVVPALLIQFLGYGYGYLKSFFFLKVLGREERSQFPELFFSDK